MEEDKNTKAIVQLKMGLQFGWAIPLESCIQKHEAEQVGPFWPN
jgi:hypothetical protein